MLVTSKSSTNRCWSQVIGLCGVRQVKFMHIDFAHAISLDSGVLKDRIARYRKDAYARLHWLQLVADRPLLHSAWSTTLL